MSRASVTPPNFSWVQPYFLQSMVQPQNLAGLACPSETQHFKFLVENGIKHMVCLLESIPPKYEICPELILHHISIVDFTPPSLAQILRFLSIVEEANAKGEVRVENTFIVNSSMIGLKPKSLIFTFFTFIFWGHYYIKKYSRTNLCF